MATEDEFRRTTVPSVRYRTTRYPGFASIAGGGGGQPAVAPIADTAAGRVDPMARSGLATAGLPREQGDADFTSGIPYENMTKEKLADAWESRRFLTNATSMEMPKNFADAAAKVGAVIASSLFPSAGILAKTAPHVTDFMEPKLGRKNLAQSFEDKYGVHPEVYYGAKEGAGLTPEAKVPGGLAPQPVTQEPLGPPPGGIVADGSGGPEPGGGLTPESQTGYEGLIAAPVSQEPLGPPSSFPSEASISAGTDKGEEGEGGGSQGGNAASSTGQDAGEGSVGATDSPSTWKRGGFVPNRGKPAVQPVPGQTLHETEFVMDPATTQFWGPDVMAAMQAIAQGRADPQMIQMLMQELGNRAMGAMQPAGGKAPMMGQGPQRMPPQNMVNRPAGGLRAAGGRR